MKSEWYACSPCQICKEESKIICFCSRVYLCEHCLPKHLMSEVSVKHKPQLIDNDSIQQDDLEIKRKDVLHSIKSKLQNEVLQIEEFKRISIQTLNDFIETIIKGLKEMYEELAKNIEDSCSQADQDLRAAISLSKLSLNVNHPILDLFKNCKTADQVKNIEIVSKRFSYDKINLKDLINKHTFFLLEINKDLKSREMPVKHPGDFVRDNKAVRHSTNTYNETEENILRRSIVSEARQTFLSSRDYTEEKERSLSRI